MYSYSDDSDSGKKTHSDMSLNDLSQGLSRLASSLPRPKSGEFRKLFEGNSP